MVIRTSILGDDAAPIVCGSASLPICIDRFCGYSYTDGKPRESVVAVDETRPGRGEMIGRV